MKFLFADYSDIFEPWGSIRFGASASRTFAPAPPIPFSVSHTRRLPDGSYDIIGHKVGTRIPWQIYRATTRDGINIENIRIVHDEPGDHWGYNARCLYSPELGRYLYTKNTSGDSGFTMHVFSSDDGDSWTPYANNPVFNEGDAWGGVWSSIAQLFILTPKGIQRYDHKRVNELFLNARRVLTVRTSPDGFSWTPQIASDYKVDKEVRRGMRIIHAPLLSAEYQLEQNEIDPPDMEFYNGSPFEYEGRYFMGVNNYSGSFTEPGWSPVRSDGHGAGGGLGNELWTSRDGLNWNRPNQHGGNGVGGSHDPMLIGNRVIFRGPDSVTGVPVDRFTYVTSWSNSHFTTASMIMGSRGLFLNLSVPGEGVKNDGNESYVLAELIDGSGKVIKGYDRESCQIQGPIDQLQHPLLWNGKDGSDLAGDRIRLRIYLRGSNLYSLTSPDAKSDCGVGSSYVAVTPPSPTRQRNSSGN
jgi:hypothetical protein